MFLKYILFIPFIILAFSGKSQEETVAKTPSAPFLLDQKAMSGLGLKPVTNKNDPDRKLFQKRLYRGPEISVYIVSSETATANWKGYGIDEFIYVINGRARLNPIYAEERFYTPGDFFIAPKGYVGEWETQGATIYYHELSVIATERPQSNPNPETAIPQLMDKDKLAGLGITRTSTELESYEDKLYSGEELDVVASAEISQTKTITEPMQEQLLYVIAGSLTLTPIGGTSQTFYSGDFLVIPAGFSGSWQSEGHHLFRSLRVTKAKSTTANLENNE